MRSRFLLIVFLAVALPLGLIGWWLVRDAGRTGEAILRERMARELDELGGQLAVRWVPLRSRILDLAEDARLQALLKGVIGAGGGDPEEAGEADLAPAPGIPPGVAAALVSDHPDLGDFLWRVEVTDRSGSRLGRLDWTPDNPGLGLLVRMEVRDPRSGSLLGHFLVHLQTEALLGGWERFTARTGGILGALDPVSGHPVLEGPFDPELLTQDRFFLGRGAWITSRRPLDDPPLVLVLASPLEPFTVPFEDAAGRSVLLILMVGVMGFVLAAGLALHATRSMQAFAGAAEAVAGGDLDARVEETGPREIARAARAFNAMATALRNTLDRLAKREALAAVGEFAASIAHELRNPLTALRLDLQRMEEVTDEPERRAALTQRMLTAADQLDRTVSGVLRVARSGSLDTGSVRLAEPLEGAARTAQPVFDARGVHLDLPPRADLPVVPGDAPALEQLFVNLLVNAAEATEKGGRVRVEAHLQEARVELHVLDPGPGIPDDLRDRVREPLFTTKPGGTGLGLAIADRIAHAHGGRLRLESRKERGTRAVVELPFGEHRNVPGVGRETPG